jgi:hypothetical protein
LPALCLLTSALQDSSLWSRPDYLTGLTTLTGFVENSDVGKWQWGLPSLEMDSSGKTA